MQFPHLLTIRLKFSFYYNIYRLKYCFKKEKMDAGDASIF